MKKFTKRRWEMTPEEIRASVIRGLRAAAEFYSENPQVEIPHYFCGGVYGATKEQLTEAAKAAPYAEKHVWEDSFKLEIPFSECLEASYHSTRSEVCERIQTGTKIVPAEPERITIREAIPEHEEPVYEWKCSSLLAPPAEGAEAL
jgi:hypothetical protein